VILGNKIREVSTMRHGDGGGDEIWNSEWVCRLPVGC
jgi:hypothetical protein